MTKMPAEVQGPSDDELIAAVRNGSSEAYAKLYERHVAAAYNMARQVSGSPAEADDLVSEAFAKVLSTMRTGRGPSSAFRAYLLTSLRNTAYDRTRRERKVQLADDVADVPGADLSVPFEDTAVAGLERSLAAQAFERLPERWQLVLWHVEIEGESPAQVAPVLGLTPNSVSALAYRAREGLRQAYLQVHLAQLDETGSGTAQCRATVDRLGAWTRNGLSKRETAQVETHLDNCERCRALAAELTEVNGSLRAVLAPVLLGASALGYLSMSGGSAAAATGSATASSGAAGALSSAPRQAFTSVATVGSMIAAVTLGLTAGSEQPRPSVAAPAEPPAAVAPPAPTPPPAPPRSAPTEPPPGTPAAAPPQAPAPAPAPGLQVSGPSAPVQLVAGASSETFQVTVSNGGDGASEPLAARMSLPPGITATVPGSSPATSTTAPASTSPQRASATPDPERAQHPNQPLVACGEQPGTIDCSTDRGLEPGESFTFEFWLRADEGATGGEISTVISAGADFDLPLSAIPVTVSPADVDGVAVEASTWGGVPWLSSRFRITVRNEGASAGLAEAAARLPEGVRATGVPPECDTGWNEQFIRCATELQPGESFDGRVWLVSWPVPADRQQPNVGGVRVPVTATLGTAQDTDSAEVRLWHRWAQLPPDERPPEEQLPEPPSESTEPSDSTEPPVPSDTSTTSPRPTRPGTPGRTSSEPTTTSEPTHSSQPSATEPAAPPRATPGSGPPETSSGR